MSRSRTMGICAEVEVLKFTIEDWSAFLKALDNTDKPRPNLEAQ